MLIFECSKITSMKISLLLLFSFVFTAAFAQTEASSKSDLEVTPPLRSVKEAAVSYDLEKERTFAQEKTKKGELKTEQDKNIDLLIQDYADNKKFNGYRIQLFAGNSKLEAIKVKSDFISKYENNYPEVIYQVPNFKVRVGNFRDRLEATKMLEKYKTEFPYAFIVQDEIELKK